MAYNHGREDRKWRIWKEAEEKILRECGVDEAVIEQIRTDDRADFNSNRRFYRWASDFGEYLEGMADREKQAEVKSVSDLLDEIENETLYLALIKVDRRTLQIVLLKMQGYSTKEIAPLVGLTTGAIYARLDHLRKKLRRILRLPYLAALHTLTSFRGSKSILGGQRLCATKPKTPPERRNPMQKLQTVNADTLLYEPLEKPSFVVDGLIPTGLTLFCGSQKIGKSWLMLKLCLCVSQGIPYGICRHGRVTCFTSALKIRSAAFKTGCFV